MTTQAEFNTKQARDAAERIHAALVVTKGTSFAPSVERIELQILEVVGYTDEYLDTDYFHVGPVLMHVNRMASPWPTYTFYVPATENLYFRDGE